MDILGRFSGMILGFFLNLTGNIGVSVILFASACKLFLLVFHDKYYKSIKLNPYVQTKAAQLEKQYGADSEKHREKMGEFLASIRYPSFGYIFYPLLLLPFCAGLIVAFGDPARYILSNTNLTEISMNFLMIGDISKGFFGLNDSGTSFLNLMPYMLFPLLVLILTFLHDKQLKDQSFVRRNTFDRLALTAFLFCSLYFGQELAIFLTVIQSLGLLQIFYVKHFVSMDEKFAETNASSYQKKNRPGKQKK